MIGLHSTLYLFLVSAAPTLVVGMLAALGRLSRAAVTGRWARVWLYVDFGRAHSSPAGVTTG